MKIDTVLSTLVLECQLSSESWPLRGLFQYLSRTGLRRGSAAHSHHNFNCRQSRHRHPATDSPQIKPQIPGNIVAMALFCHSNCGYQPYISASILVGLSCTNPSCHASSPFKTTSGLEVACGDRENDGNTRANDFARKKFSGYIPTRFLHNSLVAFRIQCIVTN